MNIWSYTFIAISMMLFLQFAGFPTGMESVLGYFNIEFNETNNALEGFDLSTAGFWDYIFDDTTGLLATLAAAGITIGLFASGRADIAIYAGIASAVLFMFVPTIAFVLVYALEANFSAWVTALLAMIFIPLTTGYLVALFKFIGSGN